MKPWHDFPWTSSEGSVTLAVTEVFTCPVEMIKIDFYLKSHLDTIFCVMQEKHNGHQSLRWPFLTLIQGHSTTILYFQD